MTASTDFRRIALIVQSGKARCKLAACSAARSSGTCSNRQSIRRAALEALVLDGLRQRLMAPKLVQEFMAPFRKRPISSVAKTKPCVTPSGANSPRQGANLTGSSRPLPTAYAHPAFSTVWTS